MRITDYYTVEIMERNYGEIADIASQVAYIE